MDNSFKIPFYAKSALIFVSVFAFVFVMYIGQDIIIPIVYATIFAILLNPIVNFLLRKRMSKIVAITINNIGNTPEPETFFNISNIYTNKAPDICPIRSMNPRETPSWIGYATSEPCWKRIGATPIIIKPPMAAMKTRSI